MHARSKPELKSLATCKMRKISGERPTMTISQNPGGSPKGNGTLKGTWGGGAKKNKKTTDLLEFGIVQKNWKQSETPIKKNTLKLSACAFCWNFLVNGLVAFKLQTVAASDGTQQAPDALRCLLGAFPSTESKLCKVLTRQRKFFRTPFGRLAASRKVLIISHNQFLKNATKIFPGMFSTRTI